MAAVRYIRYIIFALISLLVVFFISSSSAPAQVGEHIQSTTNTLKEKLRRPSPQPGADPHSADLSSPERVTNQGELATEHYANSAVSPHPPSLSDEDSKGKKQKDLSAPKHGKGRMNATFVTLARNSDLWELAESIKQVEDRFNHRFHYDWVFLNDKEFDDEFKRVTSNLVSGTTKYGKIPEEHWSFPEWIDQDKAAAVRKDMAERRIIYGDSVSYRHMCRFESGFFFRQPLMMDYEWYWRVEPSIKLFCDIDYDVFEFMAKNKKKYSFVLSLFEYEETIPTLWDSVKDFMKEHPEHLAEDNSLKFLSNDEGKTYNRCHFWSNFEVGNLNWLRSPAYIDFFNKLDQDGGFFYERWGDAPVHSIGASLLLQKDEIHFFHDIGYYHNPFTHCPREDTIRNSRKCRCDPGSNFDFNGYSCTAKFLDLHGIGHPEQT